MDIIVSRSRIAGVLPHYIYRALVPAEGIAVERCAIAGTVTAPRIAGRVACIRIAPLIAPERYLAMHPVERTALASRVGAVGRRVFPKHFFSLKPISNSNYISLVKIYDKLAINNLLLPSLSSNTLTPEAAQPFKTSSNPFMNKHTT